jgi:hypothetical protein
MTRLLLGQVTLCAVACRVLVLAAQSLLQSTDEHPQDALLGQRHRALLQAVHGVGFAPAALARRQAVGAPGPDPMLLGTAASVRGRLMPGS